MIKHKIQIILLALTLAFSVATHAETIDGRVVGIADGDTLTVLDAGNTQFKIRLAAIDAPEKAMPFGQRSKEQLSDICYGKQVSVTVVDTDRYGRTVGEVVCDGTNANETMIKSGLAWVYRKYAKGYGHLYAFEEDAKAARRGLWADPNPTAPWEWRKAKRNKNRVSRQN